MRGLASRSRGALALDRRSCALQPVLSPSSADSQAVGARYVHDRNALPPPAAHGRRRQWPGCRLRRPWPARVRLRRRELPAAARGDRGAVLPGSRPGRARHPRRPQGHSAHAAFRCRERNDMPRDQERVRRDLARRGPGAYSGVAGNGGTWLRGIQRTKARGQVRFETILPGWYPGRTPHIHTKVFVSGSEIHTGQVFFPPAIMRSVSVAAGTPPAAGSAARTQTMGSTAKPAPAPCSGCAAGATAAATATAAR
jgi:hypothetical protein